jgi:HK97 family phage major capsid protein
LGQALTGGKTLGQMLIESEDYKAWAENTGRSQKSSFRHKMSSLYGPDAYGIKTTITSSAVGSSTPGILTPQRVPGIVKPGVRAMRIRDLIPRFPTASNAIEWVKENVFTNAASPTAETISKPESALTFNIDSATVKTIAHWIPAAKQVLDDFAQLQAYVEMRLIEGLKDVEDYEIIAGDGTGQHLSGFSTEATAYDTARNVAGDTRLDKLNHAISQIEDVLHFADGILVHPRDWRAMQLIKTDTGGANTGEYILGGPKMNAEPTVWGLPVATSTAVTQGTFYVGSFQRHVALFDRMMATIDVSTEHSDYFIRNLVAIRAEERLALVVYRADALVYGSF